MVKRNEEIQQELEQMGSPLAAMPCAMPYPLPDGYIAALPQTMLEAIIMNGIDAHGMALPFEVADNYFYTLPAALLTAAKAAEQQARRTKIIAFTPQWRRGAQWAAAAVLVMGVWLGSYRYMHPATPDIIATKQLAKVDGDAINAYVDQHVDEFDTETLEATVASSDADVHSAVKSLDDDEIKAYLDDSGEGDTKNLN